MIKDIKKVTVMYNEKIVGYLIDLPKGIGFQYETNWIKNGFSISPISLPLSNKVYISHKKTFDGLYGVFWDSLPDGWGELLIIRYLKNRGINYDNLSPLTKLTLINNNGLGGLNYIPTQSNLEEENCIDLDSLSKDIQKLLQDDSSMDLYKLYNLCGSTGGTHPKAHIKINNEDWIIKYASKLEGKEEYNANMKAKECGININECKLFASNLCPGYFGTKRFDRTKYGRVHVISLAAILETTHRIPNLDYGHLFQVIERICKNKEDMYEAFARMCFNVFYGNKDDHSKNFAFMYDESIMGYTLTPAYDITKTPQKLEHEMTVNRNGNPLDEDIMTIAKDFNLSIYKCSNILNKVKKHCNID